MDIECAKESCKSDEFVIWNDDLAQITCQVCGSYWHTYDPEDKPSKRINITIVNKRSNR